MDERKRWIEDTAAVLRAVLEDPGIRADVAALLLDEPRPGEGDTDG
jgi:hypothetical protein